jgi:hypothetical protein
MQCLLTIGQIDGNEKRSILSVLLVVHIAVYA